MLPREKTRTSSLSDTRHTYCTATEAHLETIIICTTVSTKGNSFIRSTLSKNLIAIWLSYKKMKEKNPSVIYQTLGRTRKKRGDKTDEIARKQFAPRNGR